jgi:hypothetical protein
LQLLSGLKENIMVDKEVTVERVLLNRLVALGLYDKERCQALVSRINKDEEAMLKMIGRLAVEEARGGSGSEQGIRALIRSTEVKKSLETLGHLMKDELSDPSFPIINPGKG